MEHMVKNYIFLFFLLLKSEIAKLLCRGFEPVTFALFARRSNQLSWKPEIQGIKKRGKTK